MTDGGYRGLLTKNIRNIFGYVFQVVKSGYKRSGFKPIKKRWVIERTFPWVDNDRRLRRNYEVSFDTTEHMIISTIFKKNVLICFCI